MNDTKEAIMFVGLPMSGKTFIIDKALNNHEIVRSSPSTYTRTQYPVTFIHFNELMIKRYMDDKEINHSNDKNEINLLLNVNRKNVIHECNIHSVVQCPFKKEYQNFILIDTIGYDYSDSFEKFIEYQLKKKSPYQLNKVVYIVSNQNVFFGFNEEIYAIDFIHKLCKMHSIKMEILCNFHTFGKSDDNIKLLDNVEKKIEAVIKQKLNIELKSTNLKSLFDFSKVKSKKRKRMNEQCIDKSTSTCEKQAI